MIRMHQVNKEVCVCGGLIFVLGMAALVVNRHTNNRCVSYGPSAAGGVAAAGGGAQRQGPGDDAARARAGVVHLPRGHDGPRHEPLLR